MIHAQLADDGILTLTWQMPGAVNVKSVESVAAFEAAVESALADDAVRGVIVTSALRDFVVGADLSLFLQDDTALHDVLARVRRTFRRMETGGKPFVAALNGSALGGGLEIALACHRRIAANHGGARFGFPEITLGLIPGSGGTQRLSRLIGLDQAWPLLVDGRNVDAERAHALKLLDALVPLERLLETARAALHEGLRPEQPWDRQSFVMPGFSPQDSRGRQFFASAFASVRKRAWCHPAPAIELLAVLYHGTQRPIEAGLAIEAATFAKLSRTRAARNLIRVGFFETARAKNASPRRAGERRFSPARIGVIGAGFMGAGIAQAAIASGIDVTLLDVSEAHAEKGRARIGASHAHQVDKGRLSTEEAARRLAKVRVTETFADLRECELVIEAVSENLPLKRQVLHAALGTMHESAIYASNTSTLSIRAIAAEAAHPARVLGMHFFSPVDRMPLVEVIRTQLTGERSIAAALDFARLVGKTPIVVADAPGFFTSRVFTRYLREAISMVAEGVSPALIENAARLAGMPIGPLAVADETALDLLHAIVRSLREQPNGLPFPDGDRSDEVIDWLVEEQARSGRKVSAGFYDYARTGGKRLWSGLANRFPHVDTQPTVADVQSRLLMAQAVEATRCLREGIISTAGDANVASVLGWGFPAALGGVAGYAADLTTTRFASECVRLAARHGSRFALEP